MSHIQEVLSSVIRDIPDFPKEGIVFKDITTLLNNPKAFEELMQHLCERYANKNIDFIAGIDARGFIFGAVLANKLGIGFVPIRKKGKLPSKTFSECYELEYGQDCVEIHRDAFRNEEGANVVLIDDLIATGGTAKAAVELISKTKANCIECCFVLHLAFLDGKKELEKLAPVYSVLDIN